MELRLQIAGKVNECFFARIVVAKVKSTLEGIFVKICAAE